MNKILIVEDEQPIRQMVAYALNRAGFDLLEAEDGVQAGRYIRDENPDLIIMDWMLPDMNGLELTKRLKQEKETEDIPIIMLTARTEEGDRIRGLNAGAEDFICKPFSPRELVARIQAVLRRSGHSSAE